MSLAGLWRDADWLNAARVRGYTAVLALVMLGGSVAGAYQLAAGVAAPRVDFVSFWAAGRLGLAGHAADAWHGPALAAVIAQAAPLLGERYGEFFYPPPFLLICVPLGLLPYPVAWVLFSGAGWLATVFLAARITGWLRAPWAFVAFPGAVICALSGQTGLLLSASLLLAGQWLNRRPLLAGLVLGALVIKPHLAVLVPLWLLITGRRVVLLGFVVSAVALCLAAWAVFGGACWPGFFAGVPVAMFALRSQAGLWPATISFYGAARLLGAGDEAAWAAHVCAVVVAGGALAVGLWRRGEAMGPGDVALVVLAGLLLSPYGFDYDLAMLAVPLSIGVAQGRAHGFAPGMKLTLAALYVLALVARPVALLTGVSLAPLVLLVSLVVFAAAARPAPGGAGA